MSDERRGCARRHGSAGSRRSSLIMIATLLAGCATPLRPSGGPEDRTAPELIASSPAAGAVRVTDRRILLTFSERVDEASVRRALAIAPAPALAPDVRVRGRDVEIILPDSLRRNVTYVVTLGTDLRDLRGVAIGAPVTLAFATGDRIDEGRVRGTVRSAATGRSVAGAAVLAYRLGSDSAAAVPDPRVTPADYRTQAGQDGAFVLTYLRPGLYFVISLDDRNRDGLAGVGEAFGAPPTRAIAAADTGSSPLPVALFVTRIDTTGPTLRSAGAARSGIVTARFDEPVRVQPRALESFVVEDSATSRPVEVTAAWSPGVGTREVALGTRPLTATRHRLRLVGGDAVTDTAGNAAVAGTVTFAGAPSAADTARARFVAFLPEARVAVDSAFALRADESAGARYSGPVDSLAAARQITVHDRAGAALPFRASLENPTILRLDVAAADFILTIGDSTTRRWYRRPGPGELGGIVGRVEGAGAETARIDVLPDGSGVRPYSARVGSDGAFTLTGVPPGSYRVRLLLDSNGDGSWDGGRLAPYASPEPMGWLANAVRVRARWETDLGTMRLQAGVASADGTERED